MRRVIFVVAGLGLVLCAFGTGLAHSRQTQTVVAIGGLLLVGGALLGAPVGSGHARERRAWQDYQDARALVPERRRAWLDAIGVSARRLAGLGLLAVLAWAWWKGMHR